MFSCSSRGEECKRRWTKNERGDKKIQIWCGWKVCPCLFEVFYCNPWYWHYNCGLCFEEETGYWQSHKDKRGKGTYHNKTPLDIERIHAHIDSFPAMESHYARKDSKRKFLSSSLNIRKMYDLYVKECQQKGPEHWNLKMKRIIRIIWSVNKADVKRNRKTKRMHINIIISIQLHLIFKQY